MIGGECNRAPELRRPSGTVGFSMVNEGCTKNPHVRFIRPA